MKGLIMFGIGKKDTTPSEPTTPAEAGEISANNTVKEWLDHPAGGKVFREMLAESGQKESVLRIVHRVPLSRLVSMSKGKFTDDMMNDMIAKANSAVDIKVETTNIPVVVDEENVKEEVVLPEWNEVITQDRFAGKTIIVTGAGSGIGRATASRIVREGGRVIAVDISEERLEEFTREHETSDIKTVAADITDDKSIKKIIKAAGDQIDGLANVAGIMDNMTPLHDMSDEVWERVMNVNVLGMMKLSRAALPKMLEVNRGSIVNVGSEASLKASAAGVAYTTSKHAVVGLSKSLAFMYGPSGIRTNIVAPGPVLTNIEATFDSELGEERVNTILPTAPAAAEANQLAASITWLLSDDSTNVNGALLPSDGGWSVQ